MDISGLRQELNRRGRQVVIFHHWDPFILGKDDQLRSEKLRAIEVSHIENERWKDGRFPSIQLAIADAVFSKVRKYITAVHSAIRPFARAFADTNLQNFVKLTLPEVFAAVFGHMPAETRSKRNHLSNEGRIESIILGAKAFLQAGLITTAQVRVGLSAPNGPNHIRGLLGRVPGIGPALHSYLLMNLGYLTVKADRHVIRVLSPFLGLSLDASPELYLQSLEQIAPELGMTPFAIDQIVWYTATSSEDGKLPSKAGPAIPFSQSTKNQSATYKVPASDSAPYLRSSAQPRLIGHVIDIQPKNLKPTLELRFEKSDSHLLPRVNKAPVTLTLDGIRWSGTIGITASNPPYVHTYLFANTTKRSMTDLLKSLGVIERGQVEFEILAPGELGLVRVIERGQWREGNDRGERANY